MKKLCAVFLLVAMLAGCSSAKEYEGVSDVYAEQPLPSAAQMLVSLPPDAAVMTAEDGQPESIWLCDGYTVTVQTLASGDLNATLQKVTGYDREQLAVMKLEKDGLKRYECAWICAGEGGDQVARTVVLDDGNYHYCLTLLTDAKTAGHLAQTWQNITGSVTLDTVP